jgi:hypothetical protein
VIFKHKWPELQNNVREPQLRTKAVHGDFKMLSNMKEGRENHMAFKLWDLSGLQNEKTKKVKIGTRTKTH